MRFNVPTILVAPAKDKRGNKLPDDYSIIEGKVDVDDDNNPMGMPKNAVTHEHQSYAVAIMTVCDFTENYLMPECAVRAAIDSFNERGGIGLVAPERE